MRNLNPLFVGVLAMTALLLTACGGGKPGIVVGGKVGPRIGEFRVPDSGVNFGGEAFTFQADIITDGTVSWEWNFGGGAHPNTVSGTGETATAYVILAESPSAASTVYTGSLTATDEFGKKTIVFEYDVGPPACLGILRIEGMDFDPDSGLITVRADDPDGDVLTYEYEVAYGDVTVTPIGDGSQALVTAHGMGDIQFTVAVNVSKPNGLTASDALTATVSVWPPQSNAIWMTTEKSTVHVGEVVKVTVWAYELEREFGMLPSVHIEYDDNLSYVPGSFDPGAPGGDWSYLDGFWAAVLNAERLLPGTDALFGPFVADYTINGSERDHQRYIKVSLIPEPPVEDGEITPVPAGSTGELFSFQFRGVRPGRSNVFFVRQLDGATEPSTYYGASQGDRFFFYDAQYIEITVE